MVWPFPRRIAEEKQHPTGAAFMVGQSVKWDGGHNRRTYISEGYQHNVIVYRAIREVVEATKAIKVELFQGDELLTDHPALDLLNRPNPWQAYEEWLSEMMVNRLLFGETFCVGTPEGQFAELWPLNPIDMEVKPGVHGLPRAYCHRKGKSEQYFKVDQVTGESEVFYLKTYNPDNYWRGQSPLMAASLSADTHNAGSRWNYSLLKNSARPSGLVRFKGGYPAGEAIQRMREYFKAALSGERNAGEIPMLADDAEFVELSKSPMDMDFSNTMKEMAKYIASAFGVPLPLIDNDASTFNNLEQAKERLYTDTAIPIMSEFMGGLSSWLLPRYGEDLHFKLDLDSISALEGNRQKMFDRAVLAFEKGVLTREESRTMMGFPAEGEGEYTPLLAPMMEQKATETKASFKPPEGVVNNYKRGLKMHEDGLTGDGIEPATIRTASRIASGGSVSEAWIRKANRWWGRNERFLDEPSDSPAYASAMLWGGAAGRDWYRARYNELERENKAEDDISEAVRNGLQSKVDDHNEAVGDTTSKRTNLRTLISVFKRGVGAYNTNPGSVRPNVTSADQWAYARVNSYLYALRNGKFRSGRHDTDLLPEGHPMSTRKSAGAELLRKIAYGY